MTGNSSRLEPVHFQIQMDLRIVLLAHPVAIRRGGVVPATGTSAPFRRLHRMVQRHSQLPHLASASILLVPILVATGTTFTLHSIRFLPGRARDSRSATGFVLNQVMMVAPSSFRLTIRHGHILIQEIIGMTPLDCHSIPMPIWPI